jgi:hypothetical protein
MIQHNDNSSTPVKAFANGFTLFTVDVTPGDIVAKYAAKKKPVPLSERKFQYELLLRTDAGEARAYMPESSFDDDMTVEASIIEPGTRTSDGGTRSNFLLTIKDSQTATLVKDDETWTLKRNDGKQVYFAFLDQRPPKGESADPEDAFAAMAARRRKQ